MKHKDITVLIRTYINTNKTASHLAALAQEVIGLNTIKARMD